MLHNPGAFYDRLRTGPLGPTLSPDEVSGCDAILKACDGWPLAYAAYALATAYHETAHSMQPIKEFGGPAYLTRMYDITGARPAKARANGNKTPGDGIRYCGRGYVQLTWFSNYQRAEGETGYPLRSQPDLALKPEVAAAVMRRGMEEGWFTGRKLSHYLPPADVASHAAFKLSRSIINGTDRADDVADYAEKFQSALQAGGWA